jgi:DNA-binding NtrC family response regulator
MTSGVTLMLTETPASIGREEPETFATPLTFPRTAEKSAAGRVLVVDDEALVRWAVAETLVPLGYEVVEAACGSETMERLLESEVPFAAVLLDLQLPDCADLRLLARLRAAAPGVPIVLMSAFAGPEVSAEATRLGAAAVLDKPFEMNALATLVDILGRDGGAHDSRR